MLAADGVLCLEVMYAGDLLEQLLRPPHACADDARDRAGDARELHVVRRIGGVARDLHDTLLQTVQGSKMVADSALDRPDDAPALARALQQVSAWLAQAGLEGRAAVT